MWEEERAHKHRNLATARSLCEDVVGPREAFQWRSEQKEAESFVVKSEQEKGSCDNKHGQAPAAPGTSALHAWLLGLRQAGQLLTSSCEAWLLRALPHGVSLWSFPPCGEAKCYSEQLTEGRWQQALWQTECQPERGR